ASQSGIGFRGRRTSRSIPSYGSGEHEIVRPHRSAIGAEKASKGIGGPRTGQRLLGNAGLEQRQVDVVPPVQRQVRDASLVDDAAESATRSIDQRRFAADRNFLLGPRPDFQYRIQD